MRSREQLGAFHEPSCGGACSARVWLAALGRGPRPSQFAKRLSALVQSSGFLDCSRRSVCPPVIFVVFGPRFVQVAVYFERFPVGNVELAAPPGEALSSGMSVISLFFSDDSLSLEPVDCQ